MRVLVTGAGGNLGRVLAPVLAEAGHEPVLMDFRERETPYEVVQGDARDRVDVLGVVRRADIALVARSEGDLREVKGEVFETGRRALVLPTLRARQRHGRPWSAPPRLSVA